MFDFQSIVGADVSAGAMTMTLVVAIAHAVISYYLPLDLAGIGFARSTF